jgi:DNA-binding protein HU-beta
VLAFGEIDAAAIIRLKGDGGDCARLRDGTSERSTKRMNKQELIAEVEKEIADRKAARSAVESLLAHIGEALKAGETVTLTGFGAFKVVERRARTGRNPKTGAPLDIPARRSVIFAPGKNLRDAVAD